MKKFLLFVFIFCYGIVTAYTQDSQGGIPPSFEMKNISNDVDLVQVQQPDMAAIAAQDLDRASKSEPFRVGVTLPVDLNISNSGTWTEIPGLDASIWRLTVKSEGAIAIGFGYAAFRLPEGAKLFLYNNDRSKILGAYTSLNNADNYFFTNEKVKGDEITLELFVPNNVKSAVFLHITDLYYFYRPDENSMNKSGTCEVNIICSPEGNNWQDEKKGICKLDIKVGSNWFNCSGSLINNTNQNCTPYVLLADHCHYDAGAYASTADYAAWVFNFHYESSTCTGTTATGTFTKTGCTLKAHDTYGQNSTGSDFCLVQISSAITQDVYYNGWDRNNTASASGVGIHHPDGDIMKISTYTTALQSVTYGATGSHWRVVWAATTNGHGVTEGGSSGSPIFNSTGNIVGTLTGGSSYCTTPTQPDYYGKVYYHWDQNGTTAAKRLKDWLDPTNTGVTSLAGRASCASCTPPTNQATAFTSSAIANTSMTVGWTRGNGTGGVIVVARAGSAVNANPVSGSTYTANAAFGSGNQIGTGNYVVYKGTGTSVNVTALSAGTAYHYAVYEYNTTGTCYKTPALTGNATTTGTPPAGCDTLTNILPTDTLTLYGFGTGWGTWTGHNSYSFTEFAEYYSGLTNTSITGLYVYVADAYSGGVGGNHKVTFNVYQGGASTPGTLLGSKDIAMSALTPYAINHVTFDTPIVFTGSNVYVGYLIYYNSPADTFSVAQASSRSSLVNSGFVKYNSTWYSFPGISSNSLYSAIDISPVICSGCTLPSAAGTITGSATVCAGQSGVSYSVPAIANATSYTWSYSGTGATISGSTNPMTITFSTSATSGNLTVRGTNTCGNGTVSANYAITVNPRPTVTVPANVSVCKNATVAATNFVSSPAGGTFTWTNSNPAIGLAASGAGNIPAFTATNTGTTAITGTIAVTPTLNGCAGTPSSYTITVNPAPTVTVPANITVCRNATVAATSFVSSPAGGTFTWTNSNPAIGLAASGAGNIPAFTATNTGTTAITGTIAVTPTLNGCAGTPSSYTITVNPAPTVTVPANITVCRNATVAATSFVSSPAGGTFTWTNSNPAIGLAASGAGNIPAFTATNTGTTAITGTIAVTPTLNGCAGTPSSYTITVNPTPTVTVPANITVCRNATVAATSFVSSPAGGTFTWTNSNTAIGLAASGAGNIPAFTATNTGTTAITGTIAVTPTLNGCAGTPSSYTITVNPTPTVTVPANITVCRNATVAATSFVSSPAGGTFTWTNSNPAIGLAASGAGNIPAFTATNTGTTAITGTIAVTPTLNGCAGTPSSYTITVNPAPTVTVPANITVCRNATVAATSFVSSPAGGTFTWTNSNPAIGLAASGAGNIPAFTATNTGTTAITGTIAVTPTVSGCVGTPSSYTITVNPTPTVTVPANITVCRNSTVAATNFVSSPAGGTFTWTNSNPAIGLAASGAGNIPAFTATNTGTTAITGTIAVTPTLNGCVGTPSSYTITVNPSATVTVPANISVCKNATVAATNFVSIPAGATFTWTNSNPAIGLAANGVGNVPSFTATNTGTVAITGTVTVTPMVNNCTGTPSSYTITVNPLPTAEAGAGATYSGTPILIGSPSSGPGTFSWSPAAGLNNTTISQPLASPTATTTYTLTVNNNGCIATDQVTIISGGTGHTISGRTRYAAKANNGSPIPNPPTYNSTLYYIDNVIVILKTSGGVELARDTSNASGVYQFSNIANGSYILTYDKYTVDSMQWGNDVNAIDLALVKYYIGSDTIVDPSRNFYPKYRKAANVDNNTAINAIDISRIKAKIGSPFQVTKNFPKGNWVSMDTSVTMAGSNLTVNLKTICYGDYNASSSKYRDSLTNWSGAKSLPKNIIVVSDEYITTADPSYFEIPLRISSKMNEFSAMGLEMNYLNNDYQLVSVSMPKTSNKNGAVKINPSLDEIIADDDDLLVTDENGVIRVVYATTNHFDVIANDEMIRFGFRSLKDSDHGELGFELSGTGVIGNKYGEENSEAYLLMPKIFVQGNNDQAGFEFIGYPNPFGGDATITYNIPENGTVQLKVYNAIGEMVSELVNETQKNGKHTVLFSPKNLPAGLYTFRLEYTGSSKTRCFILKLMH